MMFAFTQDAQGRFVIGKNGGLPWPRNEEYAKADMAKFREVTTGKTVVMGRLTYESIGKPLPNRRNIVISSKPIHGVETATMNEVLDMSNRGADIVIIGGARMYEEFSHYASVIHATQIHPDYGNTVLDGDVFVNEQMMTRIRSVNGRFKVTEAIQDAGMNYTYSKWERV